MEVVPRARYALYRLRTFPRLPCYLKAYSSEPRDSAATFFPSRHHTFEKHFSRR